MLCVPWASAAVVQVAAPLPPRSTAEQPIELPLSVKLTVPEGALPDTFAVNVTALPTIDGLSELVTVVVVASPLPPPVIVSTSVLLEAALAASPP